MTEKTVNPEIMITNVRLSYPNLFSAFAFKKDQEPKYGATLVFSVDDEVNTKRVKAAIMQAATNKWGQKAAESLKVAIANLKGGLHNGAKKADKEGFDETVQFVNASSKTRPLALTRDRTPATADDNLFYPGCYVNAKISFYANDNEWGKSIGCELKGVQFVNDGERLGGGTPASPDDFPDLEGEAEPGADWGGDEADPFA